MQLESIALREPMQHPIPFALAALLARYLEVFHPLALLALLDLTLVPSLVSARIVLQGTTQLRALRALPVCQVATHQSPGQRSVCLVLEALVLAPPLVPSSRF